MSLENRKTRRAVKRMASRFRTPFSKDATDESARADLSVDTLSRLLVQNIPVGIAIWRLDDVADTESLRLLAVNSAANTMLRRDLGSMIGRRVKDVLPGLEERGVRVLADSARRATTVDLGEVAYGDQRLPLSHFDVSVVALPDRCVAMYFENRTALADARGHVRFDVPHMSQFIYEILDSLPAIVFLKSARDLRYRLVNQGCERFMGRERRDILGKTDSELFPEEQASSFQASDLEVIRTGEAIELPDAPADAANGRRWIHTMKLPLFDDRLAAQYVVGVAVDITNARAATVALTRSHAELEHRVETQTNELLRATEDLRSESEQRRQAVETLHATEEQLRHAERLSILGTLAASIAHELATPLTAVTGCAELVALKAADDEDVLRLSQTILRQSERMTTLIRRLLQFGRKSEAKRERADLRTLVRAVISLLTPIAQTHGVHLHYDEPSEALDVVVNGPEIEQVVSNLIVNAVQASAPRSAVYVSVRRRGTDMADVVVEDEGCGIAEEYLKRVFDPFFTTKAEGEGTGLGLAISHRIVTDHGGRIEVESRQNRGTRFTVTLPREARTELDA